MTMTWIIVCLLMMVARANDLCPTMQTQTKGVWIEEQGFSHATKINPHIHNLLISTNLMANIFIYQKQNMLWCI